MRRLLLLLCLAVFQSAGFAESLPVPEALDAGKTFGTDALQQTQDLSTNQSADTVPGYQGTDVPETQYADNPMAIEDTARTQVDQNDTGAFITESVTSRPQFQFDKQNDPLLTGSAAIQEDPQSVASSISGEFSGCQSSTINTPPLYNEQTCVEWRESQLNTCEETLQLSCNRPIECDAGGILLGSLNTDMQWDYTYPTLTLGAKADNNWSGYCAIYDRQTTFTIENMDQVKDFTLVQAGFDDWIKIEVNGNLVYVGPYGGDRLNVVQTEIFSGFFIKKVQYGPTSYGACELGTNWNKSLNIDVRPYLQTGLNTIDMRVVVAGGGEGWMKFAVTQYCDCDWSETWSGDCGVLETQQANGLCLPPTLTCLEPAETRVIDGIPVYRDCWRYQRTYECAAPSTTEEDYCAQLRAQGCTQIGSQCTGTLSNGLCESYEQTYQCQTSPGTSEEIVDCSGQTLCMDGACFDTAYEPSQDFGVAAANLGVISDAAADFDVNANVVFGGEDLRCSKAILGYSNCCKLDGWGQDIGLDQCSSDEQRLALARKAGLCHSIGSYCSASNIFGCTSRKETHCCFKSKLARIIQEQGRTQLGMGWGGPENPQCGGFTMEQLQSLDFSQIDFSEFYADAFDKANGPSGGELQGIIDNYIQQSLP